MREINAPNLIPASPHARILHASPACDGTSVPTPNVAGDRRLEGWSRVWRGLVQEARSVPLRCCEKCQAAGCCDPALMLSLCSPGNRNMGRQPKPGPGHKTPHAGAGRQPLGIVRSHGEPGRALEEASWPPGAGNRPPVAEYGTRVPSLLLTLAERERQEETARAPVDGRRRTVRRAARRRRSSLRSLKEGHAPRCERTERAPAL